MIKSLTSAAAAVLLTSSAALAVERSNEFRTYSDDPGRVLHAPYQTGQSAAGTGGLYVGELDAATFGLVVGGDERSADLPPRRLSQQYKIYSDDGGVTLQAPYQN